MRLLGPGGYYQYGARLDFGDNGLVSLREDEYDKLLIYAYGGTRITGGNVGIGTLSPNPEAGLDLDFPGKGFLPPRMHLSQLYNISTPATGLMAYETSLGALMTFEGTSWIFTKKMDGRTCGGALIGMQCWGRSNCFGPQYVIIPGSQDQTDNGIKEAYCYNDGSCSYDNAMFHGLWYQWDEMMEYTPSSNTIPSGRQGICWDGWHIPSLAEWNVLISYLGGETVAGRKMKSGDAYWKQSPLKGTNVSGFSGRASGRHTDWGGWELGSYFAYFWTSTEDSGTNAWVIALSGYSDAVSVFTASKDDAYSVRCVKD